jgi:hypothetical protein
MSHGGIGMTQESRRLVRILNDFNKMEPGWSVVLHREHTTLEVLVPGTRVFVYTTGDIEGIGIVQRGKHFPWVAEMIPDTIRAPGEEGYTNGRGPEAVEDPPAAAE